MSVRERKEVQEMLWSQFLALISFAAAAQAAVWPPAIQDFTRKGESRVAEMADPLLKEYGIEAAESADYSSGKRTFTATAWRFRDATGAIAAALANTGTTAKGNYVLQVEDGKLSRSELNGIFHDLAGYREPPRPTLPQYLPKTLINIRYILGSESLKQFIPGLSPSTAGLEMGIEAQVGTAKVSGLDAKFALFRFPTPQIARLKTGELENGLPGSIIKRSGPLVAALWALDGSGFDAKAADAFLAPVEFKALVIENEANPDAPIREAAKMMLSIFVLAGILLAGCLFAGAMFGGFRILMRRNEGADGSFQTLKLRE